MADVTSLFSRLQKLNKEATEGPWEVAASEIVSIARENRRGPDDFIADVGNETDADVFENAALIVECRNSLPAVLNLIEAAQRIAALREEWDAAARDFDFTDAFWRAVSTAEEAVAVFVTPEGDRSTMSGQEDERRSP